MAKAAICTCDDRQTWQVLVILTLTCIALLMTSKQLSAAGFADQVLKGGDKNQRGQRAVKGRKGGIDSVAAMTIIKHCLLYTSPSPRD